MKEILLLKGKDLKKCYCLSEKCKVAEEMMLQFCHIL